eukprot:8081708-Alexandrium_andersonii.AAC.1
MWIAFLLQGACRPGEAQCLHGGSVQVSRGLPGPEKRLRRCCLDAAGVVFLTAHVGLGARPLP